jgi:hypothetical protein
MLFSVGDKLGRYEMAPIGVGGMALLARHDSAAARLGIPSATDGAWVGPASSPGGFANLGGTLMDFTLE